MPRHEPTTPSWTQEQMLPPAYTSIELTIHLVGPRGIASISATTYDGIDEDDLQSIIAQPCVPLDEALEVAIGMLRAELESRMALLSPF